MTLAVRFRFFSATTPTFDIVKLDNAQWRQFFLLEHSMMRKEWMIHFLGREYMRHKIKEMWWIPLDDQPGLRILPGTPINLKEHPTTQGYSNPIRPRNTETK
ncbi:MAG: hypothetical protein J5937_03010 [Paludibacteraceae bacterium]|nr:hypothetical protein [Paludibacteraceae bacterium]